MGLKMIKAQGGIFGWVAPSDDLIAAFDGSDSASSGSELSDGHTRQRMESKPCSECHDDQGAAGDRLWVPGDWNAFFGFGTNILVNMLVLTGLLRFVLKMPDDLVFGRILPATGLMLFLSTVYYAWLGYRLAKKTGRDRRLRAALGHQRAAHVRRHLRGHAADPRPRPTIPCRPGKPASPGCSCRASC